MINKLKEFNCVDGIEDNLIPQFEELAKYFLREGYFLVNNTRKVYICDVEFYYHEEEYEIKDWIMYHRNNHPQNKNLEELGYLAMGQFNSHTSGIDITFENKEKKYRAGMLIRGFKIGPITPDPTPPTFDYSHTGDYDERSTFFYDALLNCGNTDNGLTVKWKEKDNNEEHILKEYSIEQTIRKNVVQYEDCTNTKIKFAKCPRKWRFQLKNRPTIYFSE